MKNLTLRLFAVVIIFTSVLNAQGNKNTDPNHVNFELSISLNNSHKKDTVYHVSIKNLTNKEEKSMHVSNKALMKLDYNTQYEIWVSYKGYNTKIVELNTEAPIDKWIIMADINLSNKETEVIRAGKIAYDKESHTFKPVRS